MKNIIKKFEWLIYLIVYGVVFYLLSHVFESFKINQSHPYIYTSLAVIIIYLLNKFVKPILVHLTLPLTGLTFGVFYFFNNVIVLKIAGWILRSHLDFENIYVLFLISILLSIFNVLITNVLLKPLMKEG